jgi:hypothetical protein
MRGIETRRKRANFGRGILLILLVRGFLNLTIKINGINRSGISKSKPNAMVKWFFLIHIKLSRTEEYSLF